MKSFKLTGFKPVFAFTFRSHVKSKKFIAVTIALALIIIGGIIAAMLFTSKPDEREGHEFQIKKVYVADETGLGIPDYAGMAKAAEDPDLSGVEFEAVSDAKQTAKDYEDDPTFVMINQTEDKEKNVYVLNIVSSDVVDDTDVDILGESLQGYFRNHIYANSGLSAEELTQILLPVNTEVAKIGEETNKGRDVVVALSAIAVGMFVYFLIIFYGQAVCTEVSMEKTSKLVEQLLTNISPYGLVSGKILAVICASLLQVMIWVGSAFAGLFAGDMIVKVAYNLRESKVSFYMDTLSKWFKGAGFSPAAIVLTVLTLLAGLVFYLVLAGFAGSMVTKPEEAPTMQVIFMFPMIIGYLVVIGGVVAHEGYLPAIYSLIPITGAMCAPGMILVGNLSIVMGVVSLLITIACSMLIMWIAAKIYRGLLFFSGSKLTPKTVWGIVRGK